MATDHVRTVYEGLKGEVSVAGVVRREAYWQVVLGEAAEVTLRGGADVINRELLEELNDRLKVAGIVVDEAGLTHLAYASEIASAMLKRQQADAIIAARAKIVLGAVGMVEDALTKLAQDNIVELDDERRAAMVSNLMVVLCGEKDAHPVVNAGSLY